MNLVAVGGQIGRVVGDHIELLDLPFTDPGELLRRPDWRSDLSSARCAAQLPLSDTRLDPPVRPGTFWLVGSNYPGRAASAPDRPAFYIRSATSVSGPNAEVPAPEGLDIDPDAELAVVIGRPAWQVSESDAWSYIGGITACNDLTARVLLDGGKGAAVAKSLPGFGALGASMRVADGDPGPLTISLTVDGVIRQRGTTDDMFAGVPELVARLSQTAALLPGDVIATGAPAPLPDAPHGFLVAGSTAIVEVDGVLPLLTRLVAA